MSNNIRFADAERIIKEHYASARPEFLQKNLDEVSKMWEHYNCVEMTEEEFYERWDEWVSK